MVPAVLMGGDTTSFDPAPAWQNFMSHHKTQEVYSLSFALILQLNCANFDHSALQTYTMSAAGGLREMQDFSPGTRLGLSQQSLLPAGEPCVVPAAKACCSHSKQHFCFFSPCTNVQLGSIPSIAICKTVQLGR